MQKEVEELTKRLASNPQPLSPSQTPETFTIASLPHQESPPHISPQLVDIPKETSTESTTPERSDLPTQSIASAPILTSTLSTPLSTQPSPSQTPPHLFTPQTATQRSLSPSSISSEPNYTKYSVPSTPQRDAQFPRSHSRSSASLILSDQPSPLRRSVSQRSYHNQLQRDYQSSQVHQLDQYLPPRASRSSYLGSQSSSPPLLSPQNLHSLSPHSPHLSPYSLYPANMSHQDDDASTVTDAATECGDPHDLDVPDSDEVLILKEGYLMKKGFINPAFKRRWCVLRGRQILFYKRFTDKNIRGIINIQGATTHPADDKRNSLPFGFYLHTPQDKYVSRSLSLLLLLLI